MFGPFDLPIVTGDPARRRAFMDEAVVALVAGEASTLTATYERVVRQRNRLLKEHAGRARRPDSTAWDEQLVETGTAVIRRGARRCGDRASRPRSRFGDVAATGSWYGTHPTSMRTRTSRGDSESVLRSGAVTSFSVGPHSSAPTATTSSWPSVISVRRASRATVKRGWPRSRCDSASAAAVDAAIGEPVVVLVDDPYSAWTRHRRDRVAALLAARPGQVVISVADDADIPRGRHQVWECAPAPSAARLAE